MPMNKFNPAKKIKCYVEMFGKGGDCPTVMFHKPLKRELESAKEFGYEVWEAEIILKREQ